MNMLSLAQPRGALRLIVALFSAFVLTVLPAAGQAQPSNDNFADAIELAGESGSETGSNVGATKEPGEPNHGGNSGGASVWYRWTAPIDGTVVFETCAGTDFDTLLAVYTGDNTQALTSVAGNDDACGPQSRLGFAAIAGREYHIAVDGYGGNLGGFSISHSITMPIVSLTPNPPVAGAGVRIEYAPALGPIAGSVQYNLHWGINGGLAPGGIWLGVTTTPMLAGSNGRWSAEIVLPTDARTLNFVFNEGNNSWDNNDGLDWNFAVIPLPQANDDFANALELFGESGIVTGSNIGATKEVGEPDHAGDSGGASVWYRWTAPGDGTVVFETCTGTDFDTLLGIYTGDAVGGLADVASNDESCGNQSRASFVAQAGSVYHIAVDGYQGAMGDFGLVWEFLNPPPNDNFADAIELFGESGSETGSNIAATQEAGEPNHAGNTGGASVWYRWTAPGDGTVVFETCTGTDFDTLLGIYTGDAVGGLADVASNNNGCSPQSRASFVAQAGSVYHIAVDGYQGAMGDFGLVWEFPPPNDNFADAIELFGESGSETGSNIAATQEAGEPNHAGNTGGASVWYRWTAPADGTFAFDTCIGTDFHTLLAVYTGDGLGGLYLVTEDSEYCFGLEGRRVEFASVAGQEYYIAVDGYGGAMGSFSLSHAFLRPPANDFFADATELSGESGIVTGSNIGATKEVGETDHAGDSGGASVWYRWTAPASGTLVFDMHPEGDFEAMLAVYVGETVGDLSLVAYSCRFCGYERRVNFAAVAGQEYRMAVDGYRGATGSFSLSYELIPPPPNDNFADATELSGESGIVTGSNVGATKEPGEPNHAGDSGGASVWYRWTAPADRTVVFNTCTGTDFDTLLAVYTGDNVQALTSVARNDDGCAWQSRLSFTAIAGQEYRMAVDGHRGATGSFSLSYELIIPPPPNDNFADAIELVGESGSVMGNTMRATSEPDEPANHRDGSVWYRWTAPTSGFTRIEVSAGSSDSRVFAYRGNTISVLDPQGNGFALRLNARGGSTYYFAVVGPGEQFVFVWNGEPEPRVTLGLGTLFTSAISPDGQHLVTAGAGGAYVRDLETGEVLRRFESHLGAIQTVAFSPIGASVLTGSLDGTAKLWDVQSGAEIRTFVGHSSYVLSVAFSPDGTLALTGSLDGTAKLWDVQSAAHLWTFTGHNDGVLSVAFSPDGTLALTGSIDGTAKLWDVQSGAQLWTFTGHNGFVNSVAFSPDGASVLTGSSDGIAKLWDVQSGAEIRTFVGHDSYVASVAFSPDGASALTGSSDRTAKLWDVQSGAEIRTFVGHDSYVTSVAFSPDGTSALTGSFDRTAKLWDVQSGTEIRTFAGHNDYVSSVAFSTDGSFLMTGSGDLMTGSGDTTAKMWDAQSGAQIRAFEGHDGYVSSVALSTDSMWLLTGSWDTTAKLWDVQNGTEMRTFAGHTSHVTSVAFSPDGASVLTGSWDGTARLWDVNSGVEVRTFVGHTEPVNSVAFSPDGSAVLTGSGEDSPGSVDNTAKLWDVQSGVEVRTFDGHSSWINSVAFSPSGTSVLTGSRDGTAKLWDVQSGAETRTFTGHGSSVESVAFSPDGLSVLTSSVDRTAKLWDVQSGAEIGTYGRHTEQLNSAVFSADGTLIATASDDGTIKVYELNEPRAIIVAGGGPYAGNSIARQTQELGVYTYRTLLARGYNPDSILYLNAFPVGTTFTSGGAPVAWDLDGDGIDDVDGPATREALEAALTGEFATEAGRLLVLMMDHGYRTGDVMAFRLNPNEAVTTTEVNGWLNNLQNAAPVDVTLVVDCSYSGKFVADCKKTGAIPRNRQRVVIASTSETAEAVFLPAPDLTSFMHTFIGSAYMGNSMGEAFRSGSRYFNAFPVAGQVPRIDDGTIDGSDPAIVTEVANKQFFGATWAYGVLADKNINSFFPAFDQVTPATTTLPLASPVTIRAKLLPFQQPLRVTAVIRQPAPVVLSGEPVVGLPRVELALVDDDFRAGQVWEATVSPTDEGFPFHQEGPYRMTVTATFNSNRISDPETVSFTISDDPDPDTSAIRAVIAVGTSADETTNRALDNVAEYAYRVVLDRFQDSSGTHHGEWIDLLTDQDVSFPAGTKRPSEIAARKALSQGKTIASLPSAEAILSAITTRGGEADRLTILLAADDASNGELVFADDVRLKAQNLDEALDQVSSQEVLVVIDGPGSGSFLAPLAPTSGQRRVIVTSGRAGDCAIFLADPPVTFTQRFLGPLWSGENVYTAQLAAGDFISNYVGNFIGTRIASQLEDNGDGISNFQDGALARQMVLGRSYAFAGDEAAGLPFLIETEVIPPARQGDLATLRVRLLAGIEPALDTSIADPLEQAKVYAQFVPPGVLCGDAAVNFPRYRLRREATNGWVWSVRISPTFLPDGPHPVNFYAEYPDGTATKLSETKTETLVIGEARTGWVTQ